MKANDKKVLHQLNLILYELIESWHSRDTTISFISPKNIIKLIPIIN